MPQARTIGAPVWFRTKQCRWLSTIMVALGNKGHKQKQIGVSFRFQAKQWRLQSKKIVALGNNGLTQEQIVVSVWFRPKNLCRLQSTIMVALGNKGNKPKNRGFGLVAGKTYVVCKV